MAVEENNQQNDFIEPEEDFLGEPDFPAAADEEVFRKRAPVGRRFGRKRKLKDFPKLEETQAEAAAPQEEAEELGEETTPPAEVTQDTPPRVEVKPVLFPELEPGLPGAGLLTSDMFDHIPVSVKVILGTAEISLKEVLELSENSVISLDKLVCDSLDLVINEQLIAQGEVVVVDGSYGLRITKIIKKK